MASDAEANAKEEIAKTVGKALDLMKSAGGAVQQTFGPVIAEYAEGWKAHASLWKYKQQLKVWQRANDLKHEYGVELPNPVSERFAIEFTEGASLADDAVLQDLYAKLLIAASNEPNDSDRHLRYLSIMKELRPVDVQILDRLYDFPLHGEKPIPTWELPEGIAETVETPSKPTPEVEEALWDLERQGCIKSATMWSAGVNFVEMTGLGKGLVRTCRLVNIQSKRTA
jgi:hypothetical protein